VNVIVDVEDLSARKSALLVQVDEALHDAAVGVAAGLALEVPFLGDFGDLRVVAGLLDANQELENSPLFLSQRVVS